LPGLEELKLISRKALKKYPELKDIIVFGSSVKGKAEPKDIDLAIMMPKYAAKPGAIGKIIMEFDKIKDIDIEVIDSESIYMDPLFWRIAKEGFSIKHNKFISASAQAKAMTIFEYSLKDLTKIQKVQFNRAVHNVLEGKESHLVKGGALFIPSSKSGQFESLLEHWKLKNSTKKVDTIFLEKAAI